MLSLQEPLADEGKPPERLQKPFSAHVCLSVSKWVPISEAQFGFLSLAPPPSHTFWFILMMPPGRISDSPTPS